VDKITENTSVGIEENVEGALCYLLGFITGIIFYMIEKDSDFVRFHAAQSTIVFLGLFIVPQILIPFLPFIAPLFSALGFIVWIVMMYKAYSGERYKLPVIGDMAENYS
jgi:uncharacterized membrane protein